MADSIRELFFGAPTRELVEAVTPRRSFEDVVLPTTTMRSLNHALALVRKHDLIFHQWGLAERHTTGNVMFYLSTQPSQYAPISHGLGGADEKGGKLARP